MDTGKEKAKIENARNVDTEAKRIRFLLNCKSREFRKVTYSDILNISILIVYSILVIFISV